MRLLLAALAVGSGVSCVSDDYPEDYRPADDGTVILTLSTQLLTGGSGQRNAAPEAAAGTSAMPATRATTSLPAEQLEKFRVVIVSLPYDSKHNPIADEEASVEVNLVLDAVQLDRYGQSLLTFKKIRSDREKKIYFLVNCELQDNQIGPTLRLADGTSVDLNDERLYLPGQDEGGAPTPAPIESCIFTAPTGTESQAIYKERPAEGEDTRERSVLFYRIPVTAMHELSVPTVDELRTSGNLSPELVYEVKTPLYLVRAVNKVDVTVTNNTGAVDEETNQVRGTTQVRLTNFRISQFCDGASYLFANLDPNDTFFDAWRRTEDDYPIYRRTDLNPAWMRWLKDEADKTQNPAYDPENYQWYYDYRLPDEVNSEKGFIYTNNDNWTSSTKEDSATRSHASTWSFPTVYFPETKYNADDDQKQHYHFYCTFEMRRDNDSTPSKPITYDAELPYAASLLRNTHLKINVSIIDNATIYLTLVAQPWVDAPSEEWHYTHVVSVADDGWLKWDRATVADDLKDEASIVVKDDGTVAIGEFTLTGPHNDIWYAYLIPLTGDPDAFYFVELDDDGTPKKDADGNDIELTEDPHGLIDGSTPGRVGIKRRNLWTSEQNTAKLQIMVRTADNRFLEADVCEGTPTYYTIIQNRNRI